MVTATNSRALGPTDALPRNSGAATRAVGTDGGQEHPGPPNVPPGGTGGGYWSLIATVVSATNTLLLTTAVAVAGPAMKTNTKAGTKIVV